MEDKESEPAIFCSQARLLMVGIGYIWLSCWVRGSPGYRQTTQTDSRTEDFSLKTDSRAPLLRTTSTQLTECSKIKLVPTWNLHLYVLVSLVWESTLWATERETWTLIQPHNPRPTICSACKMCWGHGGTELVPTNIWFNLRPMTWEGTHALYSLDGQEPETGKSRDQG